ncbi:MAG: hypothetical protein ACLP1X_28460 [Polyangiaceae bacterium]
MAATIPARFLAFVAWLGIALTPAQRVLCAVTFDGTEPRELDEADRAIARQLFGDVESIPAEARRVVVAVCGGWSGKSWLLCALRAVHLALTVDTTTLGPGDEGVAVIVAPDLADLGKQTFRFVRGAIASKHELEARVVGKPLANSVTLAGIGNRPVRIEVLAATSGGKAGRAKRFVYFCMDESAFFRDTDYAVNDQDLYDAALMRLMPGGQLAVVSTPWLEGGLLYDLFSRNHGHPVDAVAARAPTALMRSDDALLLARIEQVRARDPEKAAREFDGEFLPPGSATFFDPRAITSASEEDYEFPCAAPVGSVVSFGSDFGFARNSSALAVSATSDGISRLLELVEIIPTKEAPLVPSAVVAAFAAIVHRHKGRAMMADSHYRESIQEHLRAANLALVDAPAGQPGKADAYLRARELLHAGRVRLPRNERLLRQLREVVGKPQPGGGMSISSPKWASGAHGDLVSAWVLSVYPTGGHRTTLPGLPPTKDQRAAAEQAAIFKRMKDKWGKKPGQPWWKAKP